MCFTFWADMKLIRECERSICRHTWEVRAADGGSNSAVPAAHRALQKTLVPAGPLLRGTGPQRDKHTHHTTPHETHRKSHRKQQGKLLVTSEWLNKVTSWTTGLFLLFWNKCLTLILRFVQTKLQKWLRNHYGHDITITLPYDLLLLHII